MPKTLILHTAAAAAEAQAIADAARSVHFSEVDVRPVADGAPMDPATIAAYDALVFGGRAAELAPVLDGLAAAGAAHPLRDKVGAVFGDDEAGMWRVLARLGGLGLLLVGPGEGTGLGRRVATVAEWVRHAKSHHHHH